jgi:glycosyltransferase involved in cell wall biosynthesis
VVIPVFNGERHLEACLSSVLSQTYQRIEIVVSDQCSTDRSLEIVQSFADPRVRILPRVTERLGLHGNWARGAAASTGDLVKILPQDDLLLPDCLAVQTELLMRHPTTVMACARRRIINDQGDVLIKARGLGRLTNPQGTQLVNGAAIARACTRAGANLLGEPGSVLLRRAVLPDPLFDIRWRYTIDVEFYLRCLGNRDAVLDNRVLCCFRVSPQQLSVVLAKSQAKELRALFSELARRFPEEISHKDVRRGAVLSQLLTQARRLLYLQMRIHTLLTRERTSNASGIQSVG